MSLTIPKVHTVIRPGLSDMSVCPCMTADIVRWISEICSRCGRIESVWLFGSRANGTELETSDWDLLAFGNQATIDCIRRHGDLERPDVDLFVVTNGEDFHSIWRDKPVNYLTEWEWTRQSESRATYLENKKGTLTKRRAIRVWPI